MSHTLQLRALSLGQRGRADRPVVVIREGTASRTAIASAIAFATTAVARALFGVREGEWRDEGAQEGDCTSDEGVVKLDLSGNLFGIGVESGIRGGNCYREVVETDCGCDDGAVA
jgi:hypothetical protein